MISILKPLLPQREQLTAYLDRIDASRWYSNQGPLVRELEARFRGHWNDETHVVTVANATLGLCLALEALELPPQSMCIVPTWTFSASALAIVRAGLRQREDADRPTIRPSGNTGGLDNSAIVEAAHW